MFEYHMFYVLYPFVVYLLTLPRITRQWHQHFDAEYVEHVRISHVLRFISIRGLFTDSPSYNPTVKLSDIGIRPSHKPASIFLFYVLSLFRINFSGHES
jgi:hypothetical protein